MSSRKQPNMDDTFENSVNEIIDIDPKFARAFRSNPVQTKRNTTEFRTAQPMADGTWRVLRVEISNLFKEQLDKTNDKAGKEVVKQDGDAQDSDYSINASLIIVTDAETGKPTDKLTYMQAMAEVAKIEYMAVKQHGSYTYADLNDDEESRLRKFVDLEMMGKDFLETQYNVLEHFVDVSLDEGIMWTETMVPKKSNNGMLFMPGHYKASNVVAAAQRRTEALKTKTKNNSLTPAFQVFAKRRNNVEDFMAGVETINQVNMIMENIATVGQKFEAFLKKPGLVGEYEDIVYHAQICLEKIEATSESIGVAMQEYALLMSQIKFTVFATLAGQHQLSVSEDFTRVSGISEEIKQMYRNASGVVKEINPELRLRLMSDQMVEDLCVTADDVKNVIHDWNQKRQELQTKMQEDLNKVTADKANTARPAKPKR